MRLEILPVTGIGEVAPGDDLADLIARAAPWLHDGDVLVVTSKIVSKAEGRLVDLPVAEPDRTRRYDEALAAETTAVVARRGPTRIARTRHGFVMAAAGIDNSNVAADRLVLLPLDPDRSARELRRALRARLGVDVAVVVSDTMGRPWRNGLTDVALGAAGVPPLLDYRGQTDRYGNELRLTQMAVVDELAGAGELVKGKSEQVPVAVIRGYPWRPGPTTGAGETAQAGETTGAGPAAEAGGQSRLVGVPDGPGVRPLIRDLDQDMFTLGTAEARCVGLAAAATLPQAAPEDRTGTAAGAGAAGAGAVDAGAVRRAVRLVADAIAAGTRIEPTGPVTLTEPSLRAGYPGYLRCRPPDGAGTDLVRFGADLHRLRAALASEGIASAYLGSEPGVGGLAAYLGLVPAG
ncbi:coenzyme F420-0:L-glutamate ligase [Solwaraspora sp. WMMB335]|uniref:coenzyme F420-0:L-glutamate ligase n=1 Tax=Solwaraspora sp. WMMB335 TaxID=3404118 RepID=UPI003B9624FD